VPADRSSHPLLVAGLCEHCRHARIVASKRSRFLRCGLSDADSRFVRYPALPVIVCGGFAAVDPPYDGEEST